jgi:hypothetical protein
MTVHDLVQLAWIPMFVVGALVFGTGMFFFARLLRSVRVPFRGRAPLARFGRTKTVATVLGSAAGLTLIVLAFAPGTAPVHSAVGNALSKIPAIVGHPLPPGPAEADPPPAVPSPADIAVAAPPPVRAAPVPLPSATPAGSQPAAPEPQPEPTETQPTPEPIPSETQPAPEPTPTGPAPAPSETQPAPAETQIAPAPAEG